MKTGKRLNILNKCTLLISMLIFSSLGSLAAESYLSGINIQQKTDGEYKVVLKVDKKLFDVLKILISCIYIF